MPLLSTALLVAAPAAAVLSHERLVPRQDPPEFDWSVVKGSDNIMWTPCYDGQQCGRLNLPLDHSTPDGPKIQVALQMIAATDKANYKGTILLNPGGPGGPGSDHMIVYGNAIAEMFGPSFDILGFDPRGTGATIPRADCFPPEQLDQWFGDEVLALHDGDGTIPLARARDQLRSAACAKALGGIGREEPGGSVEDWGAGHFLDSASVATDMLRIAEKLGQDKVQYYGISYGSVLGQYFAAMYPDKVGRMIIDGVIDGAKWLDGQSWDMVKDADNVMKTFFEDCSRVGKEKCAIWEDTPEKVADRVDRIFANVRKNPIPIPDAPGGPTVITADAIGANIMRNGLYFPHDLDRDGSKGFPLIAATAFALETRNASLLAGGPPTDYVNAPAWGRPNEAFVAISCTDFPPLNDSLAEDIDTVKQATELSRWGGPYTFSRLRLQCGAWTMRAKNRWTKPLEAKLNVSTLILSNRYDPVTPLSSAETVAKRFGSRLLVQNSVGHCVFFTPSKCAAVAMKAYMMNGTLPEEGKTCDPDSLPLSGVPGAGPQDPGTGASPSETETGASPSETDAGASSSQSGTGVGPQVSAD
ncbi:alpha/beta-hydrolase [Auricularia subglabra TFB-10046 SS5]|nr:alpha/beta-hydrolase [Auricularia subglabra TFB-10046 SS5]